MICHNCVPPCTTGTLRSISAISPNCSANALRDKLSFRASHSASRIYSLGQKMCGMISVQNSISGQKSRFYSYSIAQQKKKCAKIRETLLVSNVMDMPRRQGDFRISFQPKWSCEGKRKEGREGRRVRWKALCGNSMQNGGGSLGTVGGRYWQREGEEGCIHGPQLTDT